MSTSLQNVKPSHKYERITEEQGKRYNERNRCSCRGRRYVTAIFLSLGIFCEYIMRVNLSVAIEPMSCEFKWSSTKQGLILSSFYIGYTIGNTVGGLLSTRFGGKPVLLFSVLSTAILTLLIPFCTSYSFQYNYHLNCKCEHSISSDWCFSDGLYTNNASKCNALQTICNQQSHIDLLMALRILMGFFEAFSFPALFQVLNLWTISSERSKLMGISTSGGYFGTMIGFPLCTLMINSNNHYFGSWINVFYLFSIIGIIWSIIFYFVVYNDPLNDKFITNKELILLTSDTERNQNNNNKNASSIPWKHMLTNKVAIACYVANFAYNWTNYTLLTELPTYLNDELNYNLSDSLFISLLPFLGSFLMQFMSGYIVDYWINHGIFSRNTSRKLAFGIAAFFPGTLMVLCGYIDNKTIIVVCIILSAWIMPIATASFMANLLDISPTKSNCLYGISNTIATIPGVAAPLFDGFILDSFDSDQQKIAWRLIFWIIFIVSTSGAFIYAIFSDTNFIPQLNNKQEEEEEDNE